MFGNLVKYELRYLIRTFAPVWAAVIALCISARISMGMNFEKLFAATAEATNGSSIAVTLLMLAMLAMMTMMVVYVVSVLQRFYKGMYGDEGYLMFTLPVTTGQLIHAKGAGALIMLIGSGVVGFLGMMILVSFPELWDEVFDGFRILIQQPEFMEEMKSLPQVILVFAYACLMLLVAMVSMVYTVYLAISLGQLWRNHPVAGAVLAYYAIGMVWSALNIAAVAVVGEEFVVNTINAMVQSPVKEILLVLTFYMAESLLHGIVAFVGTKLLLDRKLNLG